MNKNTDKCNNWKISWQKQRKKLNTNYLVKRLIDHYVLKVISQISVKVMSKIPLIWMLNSRTLNNR